jgi:hypothetical protein
MAAKSQSFKNMFREGYHSAFNSKPVYDGQSDSGFQRGKAMAQRDIAVGKNDVEAALMHYMVEGEILFWTEEQKQKYQDDIPIHGDPIKNGFWNAEQRAKFSK